MLQFEVTRNNKEQHVKRLLMIFTKLEEKRLFNTRERRSQSFKKILMCQEFSSDDKCMRE